MSLSRLLTMTYGLTLQPEEEPVQVEIKSRGDTFLWIRAFEQQVVPSWTGTGKVTSGCAVARPDLPIAPADSLLSTRRPSAGNRGLAPRFNPRKLDHSYGTSTSRAEWSSDARIRAAVLDGPEYI